MSDFFTRYPDLQYSGKTFRTKEKRLVWFPLRDDMAKLQTRSNVAVQNKLTPIDRPIPVRIPADVSNIRNHPELLLRALKILKSGLEAGKPIDDQRRTFIRSHVAQRIIRALGIVTTEVSIDGYLDRIISETVL